MEKLRLPDTYCPMRIDDSAALLDDQIELTIADNGVGMANKKVAKIPEKRGADYVAIFVRQLGGTILPAGNAEIGTTIRIRLPLLLIPPEDARPVAA